MRSDVGEGLLFRWRGLLAYNGTPFQGWQRQPAGQPTVQGALEEALSLLCQHPVPTVGASRTDTGVHAFGQTIHATTGCWHPVHWWLPRLHGILPPELRVLDWQEAPWDFHARHQAAGKTYAYDWSWGAAAQLLRTAGSSGLTPWHLKAVPDPDRLEQALRQLRSQDDWTSFTSESAPPRRVLSGLWFAHQPGRARMVIQGPGFHFQQVRRIAHAVAGVATGALAPSAFAALLQRPRWNAQEQPAPPQGLVLVAVHYDAGSLGQLPDTALAGWWPDSRTIEVKAL